MIIDEMQLVGRLGEVEPLPDETFEQARTVLQAAIAVEGAPQVSELAHRPKRRRRALAARSGLAAGAAAALAVIAIVATSPGQSTKVPAASNGGTSPGRATKARPAPNVGTSPGRSTKVRPAPKHVASPLVRLAGYVSRSATPSGNAALIARTTTTSDGKSVTVYDLYADNGKYYFSRTESGLAGQVSAHHSLAGGLFAREVAAAKLAATGNVQTAAQDMADAPDPSHVISPTVTPADRASIRAKEAATGQKQAGNLFDNWVWEDSLDAIIAGSGEPQVRAGVLRIVATLPDVTVTSGTSGGQPTLVLAAGTPELGYGYTEQLTINATTGVPMSFAGGPPGQTPRATLTYQVSRVTISNIAAGKL